MKGHRAEKCYQLIGYPDEFKGKRKPVVNNVVFGSQQPQFWGYQPPSYRGSPQYTQSPYGVFSPQQTYGKIFDNSLAG